MLFGVQLGYLFVLLLVLVAVLHLVPFVDQTNQLSLLLLLQVRDEFGTFLHIVVIIEQREDLNSTVLPLFRVAWYFVPFLRVPHSAVPLIH